MRLTVIVEDAPPGWVQPPVSGELLEAATLVVINGKVTKNHEGASGQLVDVQIVPRQPRIDPGFVSWRPE